MKINIIAVGSLQKEFKTLFDNYAKKINFFATLNVVEIKEDNSKNIDLKIAKETKMILEKIPKNALVILCSIGAKQYTSEEFANILNVDNLTFVIGGSNGVDESLFNKKISFSKMTFPHQLFRVFLIEQIYRGFSIQNNIKYHK